MAARLLPWLLDRWIGPGFGPKAREHQGVMDDLKHEHKLLSGARRLGGDLDGTETGRWISGAGGPRAVAISAAAEGAVRTGAVTAVGDDGSGTAL